MRHTYQIRKQGAAAIRDNLQKERPDDNRKWRSPALFLAPHTNPNGEGRLSVNTANAIWQAVCQGANVSGKTPHSARHAMGRHIIAKTGNVAAVQHQLDHKNASYSLQYARITGDELKQVLDER